MKTARYRPGSIHRAALVLTLAAAAGACDGITSDEPPEQATVRLESAEVGDAVLITSGSFDIGQGGVTVFEADTMHVDLPFEQTWAVSANRRFYASVAPAEADTASLRMAITIDGRSWFDETQEVGGAVPTMDFVYRYSGPR